MQATRGLFFSKYCAMQIVELSTSKWRQSSSGLAAPRTMMRIRWLLLACAWSLASAAPSLHLQMTQQELRNYFGTTELEHIQGDFALRSGYYILDN